MPREPFIFIQFAGQGVKYMDELRRLCSMHPAVRPFIQDAVRVIKEQAAEYDDTGSGFFAYGLDVDRWIDNPGETPDLAYLMSSPVSHPLIYLCQISNYISIVQEGMNQEKLLRHTHSATGFSTGIVAAALVSMGLPIGELWQSALKVQAMFFWQGVRCQQSMLRFGLHATLDSDLLNAAEGSPSCMASINNLDKNKLDEMIDAFSGYGVVHPSYELLPNRWIISGLPENLVAFRHFLKNRGEEIDLKYIPSTIAAHSPFLSYALETSPLDAKRIGLELRNKDMRIPVLANDTGSDLRDSNNIILDIMRAYFTRPGIWRRQIAPLASTDGIKFVLDFGPGTGVASLTENHTPGSGIQVIRCTVPLGRKRLFTEILPSLE